MNDIQTMKRPRLTAREISAVLGAAGNVDVGAMAEDFSTEQEGERFLAAYESGMHKLRAMLARCDAEVHT